MANPPTKTPILSLDIGTEFVKVLLAEHGKPLRIVGAAKIRQDPGSMSAGAITDISAVVKTCETAIAEAEAMVGEDIRASQTVIGIAGELVTGSTKTIKYQRADGRKALTSEEMTRIVKKVEQIAGEHARKDLVNHTNNPNAEVRLVNSAIVNLYIDGHKVSNPIGFKGTFVSVEIYTAFAPLVHTSALEKVADELSLDLIAISVEPFAVARVLLGDDLDSAITAIVIDIGGGTTDLAIVDDGGVQGTTTFSIGGRAFTRQVSERLGLKPEDAERLKLYSEDPRLDPAIKKKLSQAISTTLSVWSSGIELALGDFTHLETLPTQILLCGGGASLIEIQEALATTDWFKSLPFTRRPLVNLIDPSTITGIENATNLNLDHSFATALGLLRIALDTIDPATPTTLRTKLAQLLSH